MSKKDDSKLPSLEEYTTLGIYCESPGVAVDVSLETNQLPRPNGKHRWQYYCEHPETGERGDKQYTEWIYD